MPTDDTSAPFPVFTIEPSWVLDREAMGSKKKFWYRENNEATQWLFKFPQENKQTGELAGLDWAEKIAEQVAGLLGISHARVELAEISGSRGSSTEAFTKDNRNLFHGNEILEGVVRSYEKEKRFGQNKHTLENILMAFATVFIRKTDIEQQSSRFAEYLVLDALISNVDRHHENWGLLRIRVGNVWRGWLAPSFDHASSLGRELQDVRRMEILRKPDGLAAYVNKGHGGIYWMADEKKAPSPLELVRLASAKYPDLFRPALRKVADMDAARFEHIISRVPVPWMSEAARLFALALLRYNHHQLLSLLT